jgi:hypothetical protein
MALSNMRREPRREITESVIGVVVFVGFLVVDYYLAKWLQAHVLLKNQDFSDLVAIMVFSPLVIFCLVGVGVMLVYLTHFFGEEVCALMAKVGVDPRPKNRR